MAWVGVRSSVVAMASLMPWLMQVVKQFIHVGERLGKFHRFGDHPRFLNELFGGFF
jgi:hypothetical protein